MAETLQLLFFLTFSLFVGQADPWWKYSKIARAFCDQCKTYYTVLRMETLDVTVNCALLQIYIKSHQDIHRSYISLQSIKSPTYHVDTEKALWYFVCHEKYCWQCKKVQWDDVIVSDRVHQGPRHCWQATKYTALVYLLHTYLHCKKRVNDFSRSLAGISLTKLSLAGKN